MLHDPAVVYLTYAMRALYTRLQTIVTPGAWRRARSTSGLARLMAAYSPITIAWLIVEDTSSLTFRLFANDPVALAVALVMLASALAALVEWGSFVAGRHAVTNRGHRALPYLGIGLCTWVLCGVNFAAAHPSDALGLHYLMFGGVSVLLAFRVAEGPERFAEHVRHG